MSDIDRVFARMGGGQPASTEQRELRHIPRRAGAVGSRVVEVVRLPSRHTDPGGGASRRTDPGVRAESWDDGFPARQAPPSQTPQPFVAEAADPSTAEPIAHLMPMWERRAAEPGLAPAPPPDAPQPAPTPAPGRARRRAAARRVADPYDAADNGANCLRCGYAVEPARERRGLMTCAGCG
jgi:hypothetical protein